MNEIAGKLSAEWNVVALAIFGGHRRADDQFAIERIGFRIIEGDDVGVGVVVEVLAVVPKELFI